MPDTTSTNGERAVTHGTSLSGAVVFALTANKAGIDVAALISWMDSVGIENGPISDMRALGGGTQNIMMRFSRGASEFVLRRGPLHLRRATNDNLRREIRIVTALRNTEVPHSRLIAACDDESVLSGPGAGLRRR